MILYASLLPLRGTADGDSRYSWTVDFAARRTKAREEMEPLQAEANVLKVQAADLKEQIKRLKKVRAPAKAVDELVSACAEREKRARDLEAQVAAIDAAVFDLKAVNPNAIAKIDTRSPVEIIKRIGEQGRSYPKRSVGSQPHFSATEPLEPELAA